MTKHHQNSNINPKKHQQHQPQKSQNKKSLPYGSVGIVDDETKQFQREQQERLEHLKSKYRDRAKERRTGIQSNNERVEINKKTTTPTISSDNDISGNNRNNINKNIDDNNKEKKKTINCKSDMAKSIYKLLSTTTTQLLKDDSYSSKLQKQVNKEIFQQGRMLYVFDTAIHFNDELPSTIMTSKEDCPEVPITMSPKLDNFLLKKLSNLYSPNSNDIENDKQDDSNNVNKNNKTIDSDSDNIYSDVEEYKCEIKPKNKIENQNNNKEKKSYFHHKDNDQDNYDLTEQFKRNQEMEDMEKPKKEDNDDSDDNNYDIMKPDDNQEEEDNYDIMKPNNEEEEDNYDIKQPDEDEEKEKFDDLMDINETPSKLAIKLNNNVDSVIKNSLKDKKILSIDTNNENLKRKLAEIQSDVDYLPEFEFRGFERERGEKTKDLENLMKSVQDDKDHEKTKKLKSQQDNHKVDIKLHKQMQQINQIFKKKSEETGEKFINIFNSSKDSNKSTQPQQQPSTKKK